MKESGKNILAIHPVFFGLFITTALVLTTLMPYKAQSQTPTLISQLVRSYDIADGGILVTYEDGHRAFTKKIDDSAEIKSDELAWSTFSSQPSLEAWNRFSAHSKAQMTEGILVEILLPAYRSQGQTAKEDKFYRQQFSYATQFFLTLPPVDRNYIATKSFDRLLSAYVNDEKKLFPLDETLRAAEVIMPMALQHKGHGVDILLCRSALMVIEVNGMPLSFKKRQQEFVVKVLDSSVSRSLLDTRCESYRYSDKPGDTLLTLRERVRQLDASKHVIP